MNPLLNVLFGLVVGIIFGLLIAWGSLGPVWILVGMAIMVGGSLLPTGFRAFFGAMILGFLISWFVSSGVAML